MSLISNAKLLSVFLKWDYYLLALLHSSERLVGAILYVVQAATSSGLAQTSRCCWVCFFPVLGEEEWGLRHLFCTRVFCAGTALSRTLCWAHEIDLAKSFSDSSPRGRACAWFNWHCQAHQMHSCFLVTSVGLEQVSGERDASLDFDLYAPLQ